MPEINLKQELVQINELVNPVIEKLLADNVEKNNDELVLYQCMSGGKRIRPALVLISGQVFGGKVDDLLIPAAAVEILHNSTLIIDDIIDHSELRRDKPTCWKKYGKSIAECMGLSYVASVFSELSSIHNGSKIIELYAKTLKEVIDGEIKDILFERSGREDEAFVVQNRYENITTDDYFDMIGKKTAILLQACCEAGAICADANDEQVETIGRFGFVLGMAFQIRDDILDIFGDEKEFGKKIGKDIIEKKMGNLVILSAIGELAVDDKNIIRNILESSQEVSGDDVALVCSLIDKTNAKQIAENMANKYINEAFDLLKNLPQNDYTEELRIVAEYIVDRKK